MNIAHSDRNAAKKSQLPEATLQTPMLPSAFQILYECIPCAESKWNPGPYWPGSLGNVVVSFPVPAMQDGGRAQKKLKCKLTINK